MMFFPADVNRILTVFWSVFVLPETFRRTLLMLSLGEFPVNWIYILSGVSVFTSTPPSKRKSLN